VRELVDDNKVKKIVDKRAKLDVNDDLTTQQCWNELKNILTVNMKDTMEFLSRCDNNEFYFISEVFDDIILKFQSINFINFLKELSKKHPEAEMDIDIEMAEDLL
jgi:hypothetical protein